MSFVLPQRDACPRHISLSRGLPSAFQWVTHTTQSTRPMGATVGFLVENLGTVQFQSSRPCGRDAVWRHSRRTAASCQSTRSVRARPHFNPRAHRRARQLERAAIVQFLDVSIHAPGRARSQSVDCSRRRNAFNPLAAHRATRVRVRLPLSAQVSIHAPTRGRDPLFFRNSDIGITFQSSRPRGTRKCSTAGHDSIKPCFVLPPTDPPHVRRLQATRPREACPMPAFFRRDIDV
jgi:hypothetical protein